MSAGQVVSHLSFPLNYPNIVTHSCPVIQQQKLTNQNRFSPRKVSNSKPLFFNAHKNEAAKFTVLLWLAAMATPTLFIDSSRSFSVTSESFVVQQIVTK